MFKDRLRTTRMARGIIQQQLADMLLINLRNYQKYESGDAHPTFDGLVKLADILDVPTDYLLGRDEYLDSIGVVVDVPQESKPRRTRKNPRRV